MREEFAHYGLPPWSLALVGTLKVTFAVLLVVGIWLPSLAIVGAGGLAVMMLGAVVMHVKVHDPSKKSLPAATLLVLSVAVAVLLLSNHSGSLRPEPYAEEADRVGTERRIEAVGEDVRSPIRAGF